MVRPIGDWGFGMSGAYLRPRGWSSQRDAWPANLDEVVAGKKQRLLLSRDFLYEALEFRIVVNAGEVVVAGDPIRIMVARLDGVFEGRQSFGFHVQIPVRAGGIVERQRVVPPHGHRLLYFRGRLGRPANRRVVGGQ